MRGPSNLILVRHGQSESNLAQDRSKCGIEEDWSQEFSDRHTSQYKLTTLGREQAKITVGKNNKMRGPSNLILVRHGQSESNLAQDRSKCGIEEDWSQEFSDRHTSQYKLTTLGREQAKITGDYLKEHVLNGNFDRHYCSEFVRAMQTAALLDLPNADWLLEFNLRERDMGILAGHSKQSRKREYGKELRRRERDIFYYAPPGGESIASICIRVDKFLDSLDRNCSGLDVIVVCHGNIMEAFRLRLERMSQYQYRQYKADQANDPTKKIKNCEIFWYSRRNPNSLKIEDTIRFKWSKFIWPINQSSEGWKKISRISFNNKDLLDQITEIPQLVDNNERDLVEFNSGNYTYYSTLANEYKKKSKKLLPAPNDGSSNNNNEKNTQEEEEEEEDEIDLLVVD
eukprot:TRINITY_DN2868_c0_g1_i1.p1 TRINITY_DN2868_c0_g1~~TRINITY_DN2868_c0_g1_i1.p1  ORF type:complete len:412 (+),score=146.55 TRINITY_DN2868_c0_g1_i1:41-1237(+)